MAVLGSLELLRKRLPHDPKSIALLENVAQGAQRGTTLTKRILAFARNNELTKEAIDVSRLVHGMKELLERSIGPSFNIEIRFPLSLKPVEADANQLELALLNLSLNARDAMPDGGDVILSAREENIHAGHRSGLKADRYIRLRVIDTGEGMDQERLRRATEPFFTTKGVGKGTGLGLSMVTDSPSNRAGGLTTESERRRYDCRDFTSGCQNFRPTNCFSASDASEGRSSAHNFGRGRRCPCSHKHRDHARRFRSHGF